MNQYIIFSIFISLVLMLGCSAEKQSEVQMEGESEAHQSIDVTVDMLTTHVDLVCGMDMRKHTIKDTTIYKDQLYGFCSSYCKDKS